MLGAPDDAKRDLRRATIRRASDPTTAYCDAFRESISMFLVPSERGVTESSPRGLLPREIALLLSLSRLLPSAIREEYFRRAPRYHILAPPHGSWNRLVRARTVQLYRCRDVRARTELL